MYCEDVPCVVLKAVSEIEVLDKVLTDLAGIAPGHARTHWTNLETEKRWDNYVRGEG